MTTFRISALWLTLVAIVVVTCAAPIIDGPQIVLSSSRTFDRSKLDSKDNIRINMTFDDIDLTKTPNRTLTSFSFMELDRVEVINTTAAASKGMLHSSDLDCAASWPNAIRSTPQEFATNSILRSNATALAAMNVSEYFDFVNIAVKPLRSSIDFAYVTINVWEIDGKTPKNFDSLFIGFPSQNGSFSPIEFQPRDYFEGWGEHVNWVEIYARTIDDNNEEEPWEFCVDNLVLEFEKVDDHDNE